MRIALIGLGAIGKEFVQYLGASNAGVEILGALVRNKSKHGDARCATWTELDDLLALDPDLIVECSSQSSLASLAPRVLKAGKDLLAISVGALAQARTHEAVTNAARDGNAKLFIPAGALAGIDALAAARQVGLSSVHYIRTAPPATWVRAGALTAAAAAALKAPAVVFEGAAREAATAFPKNANVAATVALAGLGFEQTRVRLIADPGATANVHAIEALGGFGTLRTSLTAQTIAGTSSSKIVAGSLAHAVLSRVERIAV